MTEAIAKLQKAYVAKSDTGLVVRDWERFVQIPFGRELFERITGVLEDFAKQVESVEEEVGFG
jgi:hypothetical protein